MTTTLLGTLRDLELQTHQPDVRADADRLGRLLHPDFIEVGRSGQTYTREQVLAEFRSAPPCYAIWSQGYTLEVIAADVVLLRYHSAHVAADGGLERHTARTSLWQRTDPGWRLRFHQGTPIAPFAKDPT